MKKAVFVVNINRSKLFNIFKSNVEKYCDLNNLDLIVVDQKRYDKLIDKGYYNFNNFEKNQIYDYFDNYDRILRLDVDMLFTPASPNFFDVVPEGKIGVVYEDVSSRKKDRRSQMKRAIKMLGEIEWNNRYFNSGMVVCSKQHRDVFKVDQDFILNHERGLGAFKEQTFLNWNVFKNETPIFELDNRFNHMSMFGWKKRFNSYLIHYAGGSQDKAYNKMEKDSRLLCKM